MTKRKRLKDRQYNDQKKKTKGETIQWPKKRLKDRQYNDQKKQTKGQTIQWPKEKD